MDTTCPPGEGSPQCSEHPSAAPVARCVSCGRVLCSLCRFVYGNKNYCKSCHEQATGAFQAGGFYVHTHQAPQQPGFPPPQQPGFPPPAGPGYGQQPPGYGPYGWQQPPPGYQYYPPPAVYRPQREVVFENAPWGVGEAVIIFIIAFVAASILSLGIYQLLKTHYSSTTTAFLLIFFSSVVLYAFLLGGTFYSVIVRHKSNIQALGLRIAGSGKAVVWGFAFGVPLFLAAISVAYVSEKVFGPTNTDVVSRSVTKMSSVSPGLIALLVITLVLLAPVCEEIFFRGYLYPALRNRMNKNPAMILNGLLFAAAHFELIGFLPRFLLGWGLCYIYERNRTLSGSIAGHALYNGLILLLSGVLGL
jgi:membrane protease YdiL (CAAX protease family)